MNTFFMPIQLAVEASQAARHVGELEFSTADSAFIGSVAKHLRNAAAIPLAPTRAAAAIAAACALWRDPNYERRRCAIGMIAGNSGYSEALLSESLDALLAPFTAGALKSFAAKVRNEPRLIGFVMPGNVVGAGLHELAQALIAGAAVLVKTASAEPLFFAQFARTIGEIDPAVAARISVLSFGRTQSALARALQDNCDEMVVFGDDETVDALSGGGCVTGFGARLSGALLSHEAIAPAASDAVADGLARDITLFEQRGCLSPHHIFIEDPTLFEARRFAGSLAVALDRLARILPPPQALDLGVAAAIRGMREASRWRKLGGDTVDHWEGNALSWSVIYDAAASFRVSPLYRTVFVTPVSDFADFKARLAAVSNRIEAFAVADPAHRFDDACAWLTEAGVSYLASPGMMQSPPVEWPHGKGAFLKRIVARA